MKKYRLYKICKPTQIVTLVSYGNSTKIIAELIAAHNAGDDVYAISPEGVKIRAKALSILDEINKLCAQSERDANWAFDRFNNAIDRNDKDDAGHYQALLLTHSSYATKLRKILDLTNNKY